MDRVVDPQQLHSLLSELRQRKFHLGLAESCTGGLLSSELAKIPGVSDVFLGSVVTYSNQVKQDLLGVSETTLQVHGAVSEEVAREMVRGVCSRLKVECAIAVTGIAGPSGGSVEKPVGTVWLAVKGPNFEVVQRKLFSGDRVNIQNQSAQSGFKLLLQELLK